MKGLISYFKNYRENEFTSIMVIATSVALEMEIEPVFPKKWQIRRKKQFDENAHEDNTQFAKDSFRVNYFIVVVDVVIGALKSRFEQLQTYDTIFGFLFDSKKLNSLDDNKLKECCINLGNALKHNSSLDVDSNDLFFELKVL